MPNTRKNRNTHNKTKKGTFTKKDYVSGDGMVTKIWGPIFWTAMHTMSFNSSIYNLFKHTSNKFIKGCNKLCKIRKCYVTIKHKYYV